MEKIHVLLVEDEQTLAMIIKDTLEEQDFIITTAGDGEEGLRKFFEQKPDVLVADVMMPRMDGFEMVRRIRQSDKATPVLFLTARSAINDVVKGFELGANDYLKKPFGMQELIVRLQSLDAQSFCGKRNNQYLHHRRISIQFHHPTTGFCREHTRTLPPGIGNPKTPV